MVTLSDLRLDIQKHITTDETEAVTELLCSNVFPENQRRRIQDNAVSVVEACRTQSEKAGTLDAFLQEFGLSNKEGVALMCLAESLLRIPDEYTANALIAEKISSGDWGVHRGKSNSPFVNASVWGLMLTGKVVHLDSNITITLQSWVSSIVSKLGEPVVRNAILQAMKIMGGQYVLGRSIDEAIKNGRSQNPAGTRFSFDMLGEGARTMADAENYFQAYASAIEAIGHSDCHDVTEADGISIKLSALHPRFDFAQMDRVRHELIPKVKQLANMAKERGIGFTLDAEESERLEPTLDVFEALVAEPKLAGWQGLGFVLQAYQKRAPYVTRWLCNLAKQHNTKIMVRLVKGAYWDSEIKRTQEHGLVDYPVYTRKCHTDLSYEVCAAALLNDPECIYPQFATHNAHTVATITALAKSSQSFEFQRLHGMGHLLYEQLRSLGDTAPIRVYAPVGQHADLLPYLVRRLLENGANSSFVNRFLDAETDAKTLMADPVKKTKQRSAYRHHGIPTPVNLYRNELIQWKNSAGLDLTDPIESEQLLDQLSLTADTITYEAAPFVSGTWRSGSSQPCLNPALTSQIIGQATWTNPDLALDALTSAYQFYPIWQAMDISERAKRIDCFADLLETHTTALVKLIALEAGRTLDDGISEVREAIDFCRYYAQQAKYHLNDAQVLPGPAGEINRLSLHGRGVFLCISPWNFPLALFTGQIVAALVTGNTVIAKPAEQTPLVAAAAVRLMLEAGIPDQAIQFLPGDGPSICKPLLEDSRLSGVAFTGGTDTARIINSQLANRTGAIIPFIAETGGLNTMLVDSSALPEQVVDDIVASAFKSAGQRCSALRVVYLQEDIADLVTEKLAGAMAELSIGDPSRLETDIGPVINNEAKIEVTKHCEQLSKRFNTVASGPKVEPASGHFVTPVAFEIDRLEQLEREVFGPVLHIIRFQAKNVQSVIDAINESGFGLTLGIHSRIDGFAQNIFNQCKVGNIYVNRNMVGAVVGVNPFGGQGLSGTGPKAGGPHYLFRFITEKTFTENLVAKGGNAQLLNLED